MCSTAARWRSSRRDREQLDAVMANAPAGACRPSALSLVLPSPGEGGVGVGRRRRASTPTLDLPTPTLPLPTRGRGIAPELFVTESCECPRPHRSPLKPILGAVSHCKSHAVDVSPACMIADHIGVSTNIIEYWLVPPVAAHRRASAAVAHRRGHPHPRLPLGRHQRPESSGGLNPLRVAGLPKSSASYFVEHVREQRINEGAPASPTAPRR